MLSMSSLGDVFSEFVKKPKDENKLISLLNELSKVVCSVASENENEKYNEIKNLNKQLVSLNLLEEKINNLEKHKNYLSYPKEIVQLQENSNLMSIDYSWNEKLEFIESINCEGLDQQVNTDLKFINEKLKLNKVNLEKLKDKVLIKEEIEEFNQENSLDECKIKLVNIKKAFETAKEEREAVLLKPVFYCLFDQLNKKIFLDDLVKKKIISKFDELLEDDREYVKNQIELNSSKKIGLSCLSRLLKAENDLRPLIESHEEFKKSMADLKEHKTTLGKETRDTPDKKLRENKVNAMTTYIDDSEKAMKTYMEDVCWNYDKPEKALELQKNCEDTQRTLASLAENAQKSEIKDHRRTFNLFEKVLFGISGVITAGLALIGKLIYTKVTTGSATLINDITRSQGKVNKVKDKSEQLLNIVPVSPKAVVMQLIEEKNKQIRNQNNQEKQDQGDVGSEKKGENLLTKVAEYFKRSEAEIQQLEFEFKNEIVNKTIENKISEKELKTLAQEIGIEPENMEKIVKEDWQSQCQNYNIYQLFETF